ncbi:DUF2577 family protein [Brevibacillus sp. NRS-1366]|uniref:DUF2577 family protein n=1 Tax=Brevibacillus sp. NRS-1366 TaxID=3233899 RepID=UPI003D1BEFA5
MNGFQKLAMVFGSQQSNSTLKKEDVKKEVRLEFATVQTPEPELSILIDGMTVPFGKDFLFVAEGITRHKRIATITHEQDVERDVGDTVPFPKDSDSDGDLYRKLAYVEMQLEDVLKAGDRIVVASVNSQYVIVDRVRKA